MITADKTPADALAAERILRALGFRAAPYLERYGDLGADGVGTERAARHYVAYGASERRIVDFDAPMRDAIEHIERELDEPRRSTLIRGLAWSRVSQAGYDGESLDRLADVLVHTDAYRPLVILGDSHVQAYIDPALLDAEGEAWLPVPVRCWAGSAKGLRNPESVSGYGPRLLSFLSTGGAALEASRAVIFMKFGQVDLEFVYNFRRVQRTSVPRFLPLDYLSFVDEVVDAYGEYLTEARSVLPRGVALVVGSVFPPTLDDSPARDGYVNADIAEAEGVGAADELARKVRVLEMPDWPTRTLFHSLFNRELERRCGELGLTYLDDFTPFLGDDGVVSPSFIASHNGTDHHLSLGEATRRVIVDIGGALARRIETSARS